MDSFALVIFGITSNLAQIKLIPALYDMEEKGLLPDDLQIIGSARSPKNPKEFSNFIEGILKMENRHHQHQIKNEVVKKLTSRGHYLDGNLDDPAYFVKLKKYLNELSIKYPGCRNQIFYLATYPDLYETIFNNLKKVSLNEQKKGWTRLMIEKPIGHDLTSARRLNKLLLKFFSEDQIYRLDHYLGKETLQNILTFRFGNGIFEPLMNKDYIDHIQITAAEDFGIGKRGGYYDSVGAFKDVGQNHQLQMIAFAMMDAPSEFSNEAVTRERIKILENLVPDPQNVVFGQYEGYSNEENVAKGSKTETFYAFKTEVHSPRFRGVPIYVRAGKKLKETVTEIAVVFKSPLNRLFKHLDSGDKPNVLIYRIAPNEGIVLKILTKVPGHELKLEPEFMQFCYPVRDSGHFLPDPYERLLLDAMKGDQTFFNDAAEVEAEWKFADPLSQSRGKIHIYKPGTWGPKQATNLLAKDGRFWIEPSMAFCRI